MITLSHSFFASLPPFSFSSRARTTGNSPLKRGSFEGSMVYLSILSRSRFTPGTVSTRPSKDALIWNSLKRQAITLSVVALERPTWSVTMTGVLMEVPTKVLQMMSKSVSRGEAELHTGTRQNQAGEIFLCLQHSFGEGCQLLDLDLLLLLADGDILQLAAVLLHAALNHLEEF